MERVLVTGATGFVGAATLAALRREGIAVRATWHRQPPPDDLCEWRQHDLGAAVGPALVEGIDTVLHLGALAHVTGAGRRHDGPFQRINAGGTRNLAAAARHAGVRRFVYLSTVGVHGSENILAGGVPRPFQAGDPTHPADAYARSKLAGETAVVESCANGVMDPVILRAPLVFGAGVGGNFLKLVRHLDCGLPLPVGPRPAPRTLACVENLAAALVACVRAPAVARGTFLVGDHDVTVLELAGHLARLLGRRLRTLALPEFLLRGRALRSLTMPLLLDSAPFRAAAGWQPHAGLDAVLASTVAGYRGRP